MTCSRHHRHHPCRHHHNNLIDASSMSLFSTLFCCILFFSFLLPFLCQQNGSGAVIIPLCSWYDIISTRSDGRVDDTILYWWPFRAIDKSGKARGFKLWFDLGQLGWLSW